MSQPTHQSKRVNLSVAPSRLPKIIDVGRQNRLYNTDSNLHLTTICTKIVYFVCDLFSDPAVQSYLRASGGTLFDLLGRAVKAYISDKNA